MRDADEEDELGAALNSEGVESEEEGGQREGESATPPATPEAAQQRLPLEWESVRNTHSPSELCVLPCIEAEAVTEPPWVCVWVRVSNKEAEKARASEGFVCSCCK